MSYENRSLELIFDMGLAYNLFNAGYSVSDLTEIFHKSESTIRRWINEERKRDGEK